MRVDHLFGIKHYAGDVEYDTRGIIEKNRDNLPQEGVDLLLSSEIPFTVLLGKIEANKNTPPPESLSPKSSSTGGGGRRGGMPTVALCFGCISAHARMGLRVPFSRFFSVISRLWGGY